MENNYRPNKPESEFLILAYNKFYDIYEEVFIDDFWHKAPYYRFSKAKDAFSIYAELLNYEPIKIVIEEIKEMRPPMEAEIQSELFKFIRNIFSHFPFFNCWNEVWISKSIINWYKEGLTIDRFLTKYAGKDEVSYRFWEPQKRKMTYLSVAFPKKYDVNTKIYLKDILTEIGGIKFSLILMSQVLNTQVLKIEEK